MRTVPIMRKETFSKYAKRLTLLTGHQRVMLAQALAAVGTGELAEQLGRLPRSRQPVRIARPARTACPHGGRAIVCRATDATPEAEPVIR